MIFFLGLPRQQHCVVIRTSTPLWVTTPRHAEKNASIFGMCGSWRKERLAYCDTIRVYGRCLFIAQLLSLSMCLIVKKLHIEMLPKKKF